MILAKPQNANPFGEWNLAEVTVYRGTAVHKMNGEVILEYHLRICDWDKMVEESKFAEYNEWFGQAPRDTLPCRITATTCSTATSASRNFGKAYFQ